MTLPISVIERLRRLRLEIEERQLSDKLAPRKGPVAESDRERKRLRLQEIKDEIAGMTEWRKP
jgi:hypothetical protein